MNTQEMKLAKVQKSCRTAKKVTRIFRLLLIAASIACLAAAAGLFVFRSSINPQMAANAGSISFDDPTLGGILSLNIDTSRMVAAGMYAEVCAIYCLLGGIACVICAVVFGQLCSIFKFLEASETPFSDLVLKKLKASFILFTVLAALLIGAGIAIMIGLCFWCVYCIVDYGITLQTEVDETI